jgi:hypothetical protein
MNMQTITLSRALQVKNRLAEKIAVAQKLVQDYNSRVVVPGQEPEFDVKKVYQLYIELQSRMVDLKDRISEANRPVQATIFELSELKARVQMLKGLPTLNGKEFANVYSMFGEDGEAKMVVYVAVLNKQFIAEEVRVLQNEIDSRQADLDRHNHQSTIEFDLDWM